MAAAEINAFSAPSVADGLTPGERKVVWWCLRRELEHKATSLVEYMSAHVAYHRGEQSLAAAITRLTDCRHLNVEMLMVSAQSGVHDTGSLDQAVSNCLLTQSTPLLRSLFNLADKALPQHDRIQPEIHLPIIPLLLVNGTEGTSTSTSIPCYNPADVVANLERMMEGEEPVAMLPWWRGFRGEIRRADGNTLDILGNVKKLDDTTVEIADFPIHKRPDHYKAELDLMLCGDGRDGVIKDYQEHRGNMSSHYVVTMSPEGLANAEAQGLVQFFNLRSQISMDGMTCCDFNGVTRKYSSANEILKEFYLVRMEGYKRRKDFLTSELKRTSIKLTNQARFIETIMDKKLVMSNESKPHNVVLLYRHKFDPSPAAEDDEDSGTAAGANGSMTEFDYLLNMPISALSSQYAKELREQAAQKDQERLTLLKKTPQDLWKKDLKTFLDLWEQDYADFTQKMSKESRSAIQTTLRGPKYSTQDSTVESSGNQNIAEAAPEEESTSVALVTPAMSNLGEVHTSLNAGGPLRLSTFAAGKEFEGEAPRVMAFEEDVTVEALAVEIPKAGTDPRTHASYNAQDQRDRMELQPHGTGAGVEVEMRTLDEDTRGIKVQQTTTVNIISSAPTRLVEAQGKPQTTKPHLPATPRRLPITPVVPSLRRKGRAVKEADSDENVEVWPKAFSGAKAGRKQEVAASSRSGDEAAGPESETSPPRSFTRRGNHQTAALDDDSVDTQAQSKSYLKVKPVPPTGIETAKKLLSSEVRDTSEMGDSDDDKQDAGVGDAIAKQVIVQETGEDEDQSRDANVIEERPQHEASMKIGKPDRRRRLKSVGPGKEIIPLNDEIAAVAQTPILKQTPHQSQVVEGDPGVAVPIKMASATSGRSDHPGKPTVTVAVGSEASLGGSQTDVDAQTYNGSSGVDASEVIGANAKQVRPRPRPNPRPNPRKSGQHKVLPKALQEDRIPQGKRKNPDSGEGGSGGGPEKKKRIATGNGVNLGA